MAYGRYIYVYTILVGGFNPTPWKMMEVVRLDHHPNENGENRK